MVSKGNCLKLSLSSPTRSFNQRSTEFSPQSDREKKQTYRILRFLIPAKSTLVILVMLFLFKSLHMQRERGGEGKVQVISQQQCKRQRKKCQHGIQEQVTF